MAVPVIANTTPTAASLIEGTQAVSFDLTSAPSLLRYLVFVSFPGAGIEEVVWNGAAFAEPYRRSSSITAIAGGFNFVIRRNSSWPDSPQISVYAVNTAAEELSSLWGYTIRGEATYSVTGDSLPTFTATTPAGDSGFTARNQEYYQRLVERALDKDFIGEIKAGNGYEIIQQQAAIFARVSSAIQRMAEGAFVSYAQRGAFAEGSVEFYRTSGTSGGFTLRAGAVVSAKGGRYFRTLEDAVFSGAALGPVGVRVRAVFPGWQHNAQGAVTTPAGHTIYGEIDTIHTMQQDPPLTDPAVRVRQITALSGGRSQDIELLATGAGIAYSPDESRDSIAFRLRSLPDNLSPAAIERGVRSLLSRYGAQFEFVEPWDLAHQTAYDMPDNSPYTNTFVYDDKRAFYFPSINWVTDTVEQWGTFYVVIGKTKPIKDHGGHYDDTLVTLEQLNTAGTPGRRGLLAYDLPHLGVSDTDACYDGRDVGIDAMQRSVLEFMNSSRAAGVVAGLLQEGR